LKKGFTYLFAIFLLGCTEEKNDLAEPTVFLATITGGEQIGGIRLLMPGVSNMDGIENAKVFMAINEGAEVQLDRAGNVYMSPLLDPAAFNANYAFRILTDNQPEMFAMAHVPPPIELLTMSNSTVSLSSPGTVASILSWTELDSRYAYALKLECLEANPDSIDQTPGLFEARNNLSQLQSQLVLLKDDFTFLGLHRLTVYAFDAELEDLFFYDPADIRGLLRTPPDNVTGGMGYVTGVSKFVVEIQIIQ
jgi:hypothetical protein